jgi:hypothetical protein
MSSAVAEAPAVAPPEALSIVFAPVRAFAALARAPRSLRTLFLLAVCSVLSTLVISSYVDVAATLDATGRLANATPAQRDRLVSAATMLSRLAPVTSVVGLIVALAGIAGVLFIVLLLAGPRTEYRRMFAVTVHAWIPITVKWLLVAAVVALRQRPVVGEAGPLLKSSVAALLAVPQTSAAGRLLTSLTDVFQLWSIALFVIGIVAVSAVSWKKAAVIVGALSVGAALLQLA